MILKGQKDGMYMKKGKKARHYATIKWRLSLWDQMFKEKHTLKSAKEKEVLFLCSLPRITSRWTNLIPSWWKSTSSTLPLKLNWSYCSEWWTLSTPSTPSCMTYCVMTELEKLRQKYQVALRKAKVLRCEGFSGTHKRTYVADCLLLRVTQDNCGNCWPWS